MRLGSEFTHSQLQLNTSLTPEWQVSTFHQLIPVTQNHLENVLFIRQRNNDIKEQNEDSKDTQKVPRSTATPEKTN